MESRDIAIEHKVKFKGNTGDFNEQPLFVLIPNKSLTGTDFISVCRLRKSTLEGVSGLLKLVVGTSSQLYSITGSTIINCQSITAGATTSDTPQHTITTVLNGRNSINIIDSAGSGYQGDISLTGFANLSDLNYIGTGIRPEREASVANGLTGSSMVLLYTFNRQEHGSSLVNIADRTLNGLEGQLKEAALGDGTTATVTGWTFGPTEGGFRLDKGGFINSASSSLFNINGVASSAMTVILFAKLSKIGGSQIFTIGSGATETISLAENNGLFRFKSVCSTVNASQSIDLGRWYHLAVTVNGTSASNSGCYIYINGVSAAFTGITSFPNINTDGRLLLGKDIGLALSGLTGCIGMTTVHNRSLSSQEIMMNYLSTIPSMMILDSISIA